MNQKLKLIFISAIITLSSGCLTVCGPVVGGVTGGPSLTAKVYNSDSHTASKIIATPFTLVGGAIAGIPLGIYRGFNIDGNAIFASQRPSEVVINEYIDPFGGMLQQKQK